MPFPKKIEIDAIAKDGEFAFEFPSYVTGFLQHYEGKKLTITVEKYVKKRSEAQNRYYWLCINLIMIAINSYGNEYDKDQVHDFLKDKFIEKKEIIGEGGEVLGYTKPSSKKLNTIEFVEYMEKVRRFAAESLHTIIPDPTPYFK